MVVIATTARCCLPCRSDSLQSTKSFIYTKTKLLSKTSIYTSANRRIKSQNKEFLLVNKKQNIEKNLTFHPVVCVTEIPKIMTVKRCKAIRYRNRSMVPYRYR